MHKYLLNSAKHGRIEPVIQLIMHFTEIRRVIPVIELAVQHLEDDVIKPFNSVKRLIYVSGELELSNMSHSTAATVASISSSDLVQ